MNRLRALAHSHLLPLVLGALLLRALIPAGFMPGTGQGLSLTATLCAPLAGGESRTERIEIPGTSPAMHCDSCLSPLTGAAPDFFAPGVQPAVAPAAIATPTPTTYPRFALQRSQTPRGPPQA